MKKKIIIAVCIIIGFILICAVPIPKTYIDEAYGTARAYTSLTYKIIKWDMFEGSVKPYRETEFLLFSDNFKTTSSLWDERYDSLKNDGYGAIISEALVTGKDENSILVSEISDDENTAFSSTVISKNNFEEKCSGISFEDITVGAKLKITYDGYILYSYPSTFGKIFKIQLADFSGLTQNTAGSSNNTQAVTSVVDNPTPSSSQTSTINESSSASSTISYESTYEDEYDEDVFDDQELVKDVFYDDVNWYKMPYTVKLPRNYDAGKKYPVVLFLHGAGYQGNDNTTQLKVISSTYRVGYKWFNEAIVVFPQCNTDDWWDFGPYGDGSLDTAMRVLSHIKNKYSCDSNRLYVMGNSMGGYATWQVISKYPDIFAAAIPMCGWWDTADAPKLVNIPILIAHGTADDIVHISNSQVMYDAITAAGGQKVVFKKYQNVGHNVPEALLIEEETYEWLFSQSK